MIANVIIPWLLAALVLFAPSASGYFPPFVRRMFRALSLALAIGAVFLFAADFIYAWPDCATAPWWLLWCDWDNANPHA